MNTKTIAKAVKATVSKNSVIPACSQIQFTGSNLIATDLETWISIPYATPFKFCAEHDNIINMWETLTDGYDVTQDESSIVFQYGKAKIKMMAQDYETYPMLPEYEKDVDIVKLLDSDVKLLTTANDFISSDVLRPSLMNICLRKGKMYATDCHSAMFHPLESDIQDDVFVSKKVRTLLQLWNGDWDVYAGSTYTSFTNADGVVITTRTNDERYPDIENVIPRENPVELKVIVKEFTDIIKTGSKFANKSSNRMAVVCNEGKTTLSFSDEDLGQSYEAELELQSVNDNITIGFNSKFLDRVFKHCGNKAIIEMSTPNRAAVINGTFLLMPVMLTNEN
jgi:DNA polymerase-3 subunit beta